MITIRIEPYKKGSKGAKALSKHTGILLATDRQVRKHGSFDVVINWGNSERRFRNARYINDPEAVAIASNKARSFERFERDKVPCPDWTTDYQTALGWLYSGEPEVCVVARHILTGRSGHGIQLIYPANTGDVRRGDRAGSRGGEAGGSGSTADGGDGVLDAGRGAGSSGDGGVAGSIVRAPLYTKYVKKAEEYRVHVVRGEVIDVQMKRKRQEVPNEEVDYKVRNSANGWVYCRDGVTAPECVRSAAIGAVASCGLDFGAADVGFNRHKDQAYVFEVNTAPGLEGTTLDRYYEALAGLLPSIRGGRYSLRRGK